MKKTDGYEMVSDRAFNALLGKQASTLNLSARALPRAGQRVALAKGGERHG